MLIWNQILVLCGEKIPQMVSFSLACLIFKTSILVKVSLWQTGKSLRWNQDNIRDAERRQFRLDSESCSLGTITNVPPGGIYIQLEKDRAPKPVKKQNTRSILY